MTASAGPPSAAADPLIAAATAPMDDLLDRAARASDAMDAPRLTAALKVAAARLSLAGAIDRLAMPTLRRVGNRWAAGASSIDQERFTTETIRSWLSLQQPDPGDGAYRAPVLLACAPTDQHTVASEALAVLLRVHGRPCRTLGPRLPLRDLVLAVKASEAVAVVVVAQLDTGLQRATEAMAAVQELGVVTYCAGRAFDALTTVDDLPGSYLGRSIGDAAHQILSELAQRPDAA